MAKRRLATTQPATARTDGVATKEPGTSPSEDAQAQQREALRRVLASFYEGDAEEQRETWEFLKKALDEDRPSDRKLFP